MLSFEQQRAELLVQGDLQQPLPWIQVAPPDAHIAAALDPWVKTSLADALAAFRRFRLQHQALV